MNQLKRCHINLSVTSVSSMIR